MTDTLSLIRPTAADIAAVARCLPHLTDLDERRIAARTIACALAQGWSVSVCDGIGGEGEWVVKQSTDAATICKAMASSDGDALRFYDAPLSRIGTVYFVYGNGEDLWSDNTDQEILNELSAFATAP